MNALRTTIPLTLVILALASPIGLATHGGFHHAGTLKGMFATPVLSSSNGFVVDLAAGETMDIAVEWFDPAADLDLGVISPAGSCTVFPNPDVPCLTNRVESLANSVTCPAGNDGRTLLGVSPETRSYTASVTGQHTITVLANAGDVVSGINYVLTVDGGANVNGPTSETNYIRIDACRDV